jgi:hypothetical protein
VNVKTDAEQNERPEHDREERGQDLLPRAQMIEVVVSPGDRDADPDPDEREKAAAKDHDAFLSAPTGAKR